MQIGFSFLLIIISHYFLSGSVVVVADDLVVVVEDVQEVVDLDAKPTIESSSKIFPLEHLGRLVTIVFKIGRMILSVLIQN